MSRPTKKTVIRYHLPTGQRCAADAPGAIRSVEKSAKYYGRVRGRSVSLCSDYSRSKRMLAEMLDNDAYRKAGLIEPRQTGRPLLAHLEDFEQALRTGNTVAYVKLVLGRLRAIAAGCGWQALAEMNAVDAEDWLRREGQGGGGIGLPEGQEWFTPRETARLLGVSLAAIRSSIQRHRLPAEGRGRKRRYPRATVQALADRQGLGMGAQTRNYHRVHLKTFGNWLVRNRRLAENPFAHLEAEGTTTDRRHDRRDLTAEELRRLLTATRASGRSYRGLSGEDRYFLYALACGTGFRATSLANLTPELFDLDSPTPVVTLPARFAKNRKTKEQPLPQDLAEALAAHLAGRPSGKPVWGGTWARDHRGAEMLRADLAEAGIAYRVEGPDGPLFVDFHSLRHSYLTLGGRSGIDLRTLQLLAGHSKPELTARYSHRRLVDLAGAVEKMPSLLPEVGQEEGRLASTGTGGAGFGCSMVARNQGNQGHSGASPGQQGGKTIKDSRCRKSLPDHPLSSAGIASHQRGRRDSNPQPPDRQSETGATDAVAAQQDTSEVMPRLLAGCPDEALDRLNTLWPSLPAHVRQAITMLAEAHEKTKIRN